MEQRISLGICYTFFYFVRINVRLFLPRASGSAFLFSEIILLMNPHLKLRNTMHENPLFVFLKLFEIAVRSNAGNGDRSAMF